jgi:hypothetical protein
MIRYLTSRQRRTFYVLLRDLLPAKVENVEDKTEDGDVTLLLTLDTGEAVEAVFVGRDWVVFDVAVA